MYIAGHIAAPYLASRYLKVDAHIAIAASLLPDVVDKIGYYVLRATPGGRVPAHTLLGLATTLLAASLVGLLLRQPRRVAYAWALGYGSHLALDFLSGLVPLLWPFVSYDFAGYAPLADHWLYADLWRVGMSLAVESCLTVWALIVWRRQHRHSPQSVKPLEARAH